MRVDDYKRIYSQLRKPSDIDHLAHRLGGDRELLLVLYTQRTVRDATRRFYIVKKDMKKIAREWDRGMPIERLTEMMKMPPGNVGFMKSGEERLRGKQK